MRFSRVWLRYGRRAPWVLEDVDLELPPGQAAVVLGRNGAGKTTLPATAAGLLRPARGTLRDRPRRVGWVPERFPANQPVTLTGYLLNMGRIRGLEPAAARAVVGRWAERLHLERYLNTALAEVSKGTAQKVGLAQALLVPPDLLVLDEPWEGLDAQTREQVPAIVAEVLDAGGSVLISDHLGEVARVPDARRWHISGGRVTEEVAAVASDRWVIEVSVAATDARTAVARLQAQGHDILGVRRA